MSWQLRRGRREVCDCFLRRGLNFATCGLQVKLKFPLEGPVAAAASSAVASFERLKSATKVRQMHFDDFGGDAIKRMGYPPDALLQMAFQVYFADLDVVSAVHAARTTSWRIKHVYTNARDHSTPPINRSYTFGFTETHECRPMARPRQRYSPDPDLPDLHLGPSLLSSRLFYKTKGAPGHFVGVLIVNEKASLLMSGLT